MTASIVSFVDELVKLSWGQNALQSEIEYGTGTPKTVPTFKPGKKLRGVVAPIKPPLK